MYYTSSDDASGVQAIGVAVASDPKGPYVDKSSRPLICELNEGGSTPEEHVLATEFVEDLG
jgi:hypothetical protein